MPSDIRSLTGTFLGKKLWFFLSPAGVFETVATVVVARNADAAANAPATVGPAAGLVLLTLKLLLGQRLMLLMLPLRGPEHVHQPINVVI